MPTWLKIVLGVVAAAIFIFGAVVVVGVTWFKSHKGELVEAGKQAMEEGRTFGRNQPRSACIDEGLRRLASLDGLTAEIRNNLFAKGCLEVAQEAPDFCEGVPASSEIVATVKWRAGVCAARTGVDPQRCQRFLQTWQESCHPVGKP